MLVSVRAEFHRDRVSLGARKSSSVDVREESDEGSKVGKVGERKEG